MGILLGLLTALTWGSADFIARFATHRVGTLRTMLYMQVTGFLLLTISMPWLGGWGHLADGSGWQPWAWGFLAGLLNACATLSLYRSFEIGKMAVVAPLSASYPAIFPISKERYRESVAQALRRPARNPQAHGCHPEPSARCPQPPDHRMETVRSRNPVN